MTVYINTDLLHMETKMWRSSFVYKKLHAAVHITQVLTLILCGICYFTLQYLLNIESKDLMTSAVFCTRSTCFCIILLVEV